jgi:hypothetical protein
MKLESVAKDKRITNEKQKTKNAIETLKKMKKEYFVCVINFKQYINTNTNTNTDIHTTARTH